MYNNDIPPTSNYDDLTNVVSDYESTQIFWKDF